MSDKTEMVKLRVTPDEKARWQQEAERQGIGLSELIRSRMNEPTVLDPGLSQFKTLLQVHGLENSGLAAYYAGDILPTNTKVCGCTVCACDQQKAQDLTRDGVKTVDVVTHHLTVPPVAPTVAFTHDVPTTEPTDSVEKKPWMFGA